MRRRGKVIREWAEKNGHQFQAETTDFTAPGARELDCFRRWYSATHHVMGTYRGRPFEMLDLRRHFRGSPKIMYDQTVLLLPGASANLPDFEILPRSSKALKAIKLGGLALRVDNDTPREMKELMETFNRDSMLYPGGVLESFIQGIRSPQEEPDLSVAFTICQPSVLRLLTRNRRWFVEAQNGFLAIFTPDKLLSEDESEELLADATEFIELLHEASKEPPIQGLTAETTMQPKRLLPTVIGVLVGFFLGVFLASGLHLAEVPHSMLLLPVLPFSGAILGGMIGRMFNYAPSNPRPPGNSGSEPL